MGVKDTILIVDDSEGPRVALKTLCKVSNVPCLTASSGEEGWKTFQANQDKIGLVISDGNMESATAGVDLLEKIRKLDPTLALVLNTSDPDTAKAAPNFAGLNAQLIVKPLGMSLAVFRGLVEKMPKPSAAVADTVFIIHKDIQMRGTLKSEMEHLGFKVIAVAPNGIDEAYKANSGSIGAILTNQEGMAFVEAVKKTSPSIPVSMLSVDPECHTRVNALPGNNNGCFDNTVGKGFQPMMSAIAFIQEKMPKPAIGKWTAGAGSGDIQLG